MKKSKRIFKRATVIFMAATFLIQSVNITSFAEMDNLENLITTTVVEATEVEGSSVEPESKEVLNIASEENSGDTSIVIKEGEAETPENENSAEAESFEVTESSEETEKSGEIESAAEGETAEMTETDETTEPSEKNGGGRIV